jgi:nucleotidyltransferase AbiEii toxin of type IV toxin-antitoxin system
VYARVVALLRGRGIPFAVVGATALAVHGVSRATRDVDVLVTDPICLADATWATLRQAGVAVTIRRGDADDPLAGVVRCAASDASPVDVVVGKTAWQARVLERAAPGAIDEVVAPIASVADLVLLKLYAAGPQDAWDIAQLLETGDRAALVADVEATLPALPEDARRLWARVVESR